MLRRSTGPTARAFLQSWNSTYPISHLSCCATSSMNTTTFDIHLASDIMSDRLAKQLAEVGFTRDEFIGGTTGVVHPCHYSNHPTSDDELESKWQNSLLVLSHASR